MREYPWPRRVYPHASLANGEWHRLDNKRREGAFDIWRSFAKRTEDQAANRVERAQLRFDRTDRARSRVTKPHIDFASLGGVHRRQGPRLPGNCSATVLCRGVAAGADMQGLELEEKFTLRAVKGKGEDEVRDQTSG